MLTHAHGPARAELTRKMHARCLDLRGIHSYMLLFRRDSGGHVRQRREPQQFHRVFLHRGRGGPLAPRFAWISCIHKLALIVERLFVTFKYKIENILQTGSSFGLSFSFTEGGGRRLALGWTCRKRTNFMLNHDSS